MLLLQWVLWQVPSYKLGVLVRFTSLLVAGCYYRAQTAAEMANSFLSKLEEELRGRLKFAMFRLYYMRCPRSRRFSKLARNAVTG